MVFFKGVGRERNLFNYYCYICQVMMIKVFLKVVSLAKKKSATFLIDSLGFPNRSFSGPAGQGQPPCANENEKEGNNILKFFTVYAVKRDVGILIYSPCTL